MVSVIGRKAQLSIVCCGAEVLELDGKLCSVAVVDWGAWVQSDGICEALEGFTIAMSSIEIKACLIEPVWPKGTSENLKIVTGRENVYSCWQRELKWQTIPSDDSFVGARKFHVA